MPNILFTVRSGSPAYSNNALKNGDRRATHRQTPTAHNRYDKNIRAARAALLTARRMPSTPATAALKAGRISAAQQQLKKAIAAEKNDPKYWNDRYPRRQLGQSSSWVGNIRFYPDVNNAKIMLGGHKYYDFPMNADAVARLLNSPSLGRHLNRYYIRH